jgi:hypothetical protein
MKVATVKISEIANHPTKRMDAEYWVEKKSEEKIEPKEKPNPSLFLNVMKVYLDKLLVKKIIPIPYNNAKNEVYFDMLTLISEDEHSVFKQALADFESITDIEDWYND